MNPKNAIGLNVGHGSTAFTKVGGNIQHATQAAEHPGIEFIRRYRGWLRNIRLPVGRHTAIGERSKPPDPSLPSTGPMIQMRFDSAQVDEVWGETWFRLLHDPAELVQQYGTEDTMLRSAIRVELSMSGTSIRNGAVKIVGDRTQERTHTNYTKTPVRCWGDVMTSIAKGGP